MVTKSQMNQTVPNIPERLTQMSQQGPESVQNILSWNTYNHSYSIEADQQWSAQSPLETSFYEDEYKTMVCSMDNQKVVSPKSWKISDAFGKLLKLSVLADEGCRAEGNIDLGFVHNLPPTTPPACETKSQVSIHSLWKLKNFHDEKHELFMKRIHLMEMKDIERFERIQLLKKWDKSIVHEGFVDTRPDEDFRAGSTHEQREGDLRISNTSQGSNMNCVPKADCTGVSDTEKYLKMGSVRCARDELGKAEDLFIDSKVEDDFMVSSIYSKLLEDKPMSVSKQKVQKSTTRNRKVSPCRHFIKG